MTPNLGVAMSTRRNWLSAVAAAGAVVVVAVVLVLVSSRVGERSASPPTTTDTPAWTTFAAEVVGVRRGDERTAIVEVELPAGRSDCARDLRVELLEDQLPDRPTVIYANIVFSSAGTAVADACPDQTPAEVAMPVAQPLADRVLMFNSMTPQWAPEGDRYRSCDEHLGCYPPADHCDPVWIDQAVYYMDVPVNRIRGVRDVVACDGTWLVLELNRGAGNCPPTEGVAQPCVVDDKTNRLFLHFGQHGWDSVAGTRDAGCAAVHTERPDFPAALCESLPPVG